MVDAHGVQGILEEALGYFTISAYTAQNFSHVHQREFLFPKTKDKSGVLDTPVVALEYFNS